MAIKARSGTLTTSFRAPIGVKVVGLAALRAIV
jgi:hypothetical protein